MKGTYSRGKKLYPAHYALLYYTRGQPKTFNRLRVPVPTCRHCGKEVKDYSGHRDKLNPLGLNLTDFWEDTSPNRHRKFKVRPGVDELKLMIPERAILISTNENDIVFDPFGGGGATFQAAELNHRFSIGTELYDSRHILRRFEERFPFSVGKKPEFNIQELLRQDEDHENAVLRRHREKVCRLGLADLLFELQDVLLSVNVRLKEEREANGAAVLRELGSMLNLKREAAGKELVQAASTG